MYKIVKWYYINEINKNIKYIKYIKYMHCMSDAYLADELEQEYSGGVIDCN